MSDALKFLVGALRKKPKAVPPKPVVVDRHIRLQAVHHALQTGGSVYFHHPSEGFVPLGIVKSANITVNVFPDYTEFEITGIVDGG